MTRLTPYSSLVENARQRFFGDTAVMTLSPEMRALAEVLVAVCVRELRGSNDESNGEEDGNVEIEQSQTQTHDHE